MTVFNKNRLSSFKNSGGFSVSGSSLFWLWVNNIVVDLVVGIAGAGFIRLAVYVNSTYNM